MPFFSKLDGITGDLRIGLGGPILRKNGNDLEVRLPDDSGQAQVLASNVVSGNAMESFFHDEGTVVAGNDVAVTANIPHVAGCYWAQTAAADQDIISHDFEMEGGNYTFKMYCVTSADSGIVDILIDDVEEASFDLYTSGTTYLVLKTQATIAISGGRHTLKLKVDGKNASSSDYYAKLTQYWLVQE